MMRALLAAVLLLAAGPAWADLDTYLEAEKGRALAVAGDCIACHTAPNRQPFSGGRGIETPFGTITSANLTPDLETGLGTWTADEFYRAMHEGVRQGGAYLYPAFPYPFYTRVTRADSDAIYAFLRTLPAVSHKVDRNTLPFPFNIRTSMFAWNTLFFTPGEFQPEAGKSAAYNRGAYLVEGLGHCGACHTPMNALGGSKGSQALQGNEIQAWIAPNITADTRIGVGAWSIDAIVEYLRTGRNAMSTASGPMAEVVQYSTAFMPEDDLRAMATYLKERAPPAATARTPLAESDAAMQAGRSIYLDTCAACHAADGSGVERLFPRLSGSPAVQQTDATTLARVVIAGTKAAVTQGAVTGPAMPSLGWRLSDDQVASVLTYIRNAWGNAAPSVSAGDAARVRTRVTGR